MIKTSRDNGNNGIIVSASPKVIRNCIIACGVAMLIVIAILVYNIIMTKDYVKVDAQVTKVIEYNRESTSKSTIKSKNKNKKQRTTTYVITYEFTYNAKEYLSEQELSNKPNEQEGDIVQIRCNPDNPEQIENTHIIKTSYIFIVVLTAFSIILLVMYRKARKV